MDSSEFDSESVRRPRRLSSVSAGKYVPERRKRRRGSVDGAQSFSKSYRGPNAKKQFDPSLKDHLLDFNVGHSWKNPSECPLNDASAEVSEGSTRKSTQSEKKLAADSVATQWQDVRAATDGAIDICGFRLVDMCQLCAALLAFCCCNVCGSGKRVMTTLQ